MDGVYIHPASLNSIPLYDPYDNARQWIERVERIAALYGWSDACKLNVAICRLGEEAAAWHMGMGHITNTWRAFRQAFFERYDLDRRELFRRLAHCRQGHSESVRTYADRYRRLSALLGVDPDGDPLHMHNFLQGLNERVYRRVFLMRPETLDQAVHL
ncbi:hypothetical protein GPECTOR_3g382 [Gonium pectorale]|uniref:Retrotransposon gag domain-containing protein n=1 Tax=Gonium pectorale TaxID=33097 RepID=A0A150GZU3_GONPE|nr:hypothetical protein GPECTOR_3g382 [Gonium pectorale]|eukprot:KXZ55242.1 hypothetical protein GPECTOR_3g382 [Gonium pectorale]